VEHKPLPVCLRPRLICKIQMITPQILGEHLARQQLLRALRYVYRE
jgi:hypothetical protein